MPSRLLAICVAFFSLAAAAAAAETIYQDPPGRFTVAVPDRWAATAQDTGGMGGVQLRHAASWVLIGPFGGAETGSAALAQLTEQFKGQYRSLAPLKQGDCKVGGQPALFATFDAVNSHGGTGVLTLVGVESATAGIFVVIAFAPHYDATAEATLTRIRESVKWYEPGALTAPAPK